MIKLLSIFSYYVLPLLLVILSVFFPNKDLFVAFWNISLYLLIFIVFIKPIWVVFDIMFIKKFLYLRKQLWVMTFYFALFHSIWFMVVRNLFDINSYVWVDSFLFWWLVGFIGMFILAITSNNFSVRLLKRNWKRLHYLTYPVLFAVLLHVALFKNEFTLFFIILMLFLVLKIFEYKKL